MNRFARNVVARPLVTLGLWLVAIALLAMAGFGTEEQLRNPVLIADGSSSDRAQEIVEEEFPRSTVIPVLLQADAELLDDEGPAIVEQLSGVDGAQVISPWTPGAPAELRPDPNSALVLVDIRGPQTGPRPEADTRASRAVRAAIEDLPAGMSARASGSATVFDELRQGSEEAAVQGELVAAPILVMVLLLVLRTPLAALIPALFGGVGVLGGMGVLRGAAEVTDLTVFAATLTSMMGLALGVDYALLVIARFREERSAGADPRTAAAVAASRAGHTILIAATVLALAMVTAIVLSNGNLLVSPALGVLAALLVTVGSAVTGLPAVLVLADPWLEKGRRPAGAGGGRAAAIAEKALSRPIRSIALVAVPLVALAAPGIALETGPGDVRQLSESSAARQDVEAVAGIAGAGWTGPVQVVVRGEITPGEQADLASELQADPDVALVLPGEVSPSGTTTRVTVIPRTAPNTPATADLVARVHSVADELAQRTGAETAVGGVGAELADFDAATTDQLPIVVLGLSLVTLLVLVLLFRAPLLALVSVALNLVTVAVAFGVIALLFQGSDPPLGGSGYLEVIAVVSMFTVMFGLSIDYQVFLLDRMREGLQVTGDPRSAVTWGLRRTARVVTGAAAIMLGVFLAFATTEVSTIRQFGIGLSVAIAVDATVVRLILLPAAMHLGGRWTWWPVDRSPTGGPARLRSEHVSDREPHEHDTSPAGPDQAAVRR
jgi:RND superfamily putative drug exporter